MADKYFIERVQIASGTGAATIGGLVGETFNPGITRVLSSGSNLLDPTLHALVTAEAEFTFTTLDIKTALDAMFGDSHIVPHLAIGDSHSTTVVIWLQSNDGAGRGGTATTDNITLTINQGTMTPVRITNQGGVAVLECRIDVSFDGTNLPVVRSAANQNLPSASAPSAALYRLSAVQDVFAGAVEPIQNLVADWSLDFGISVFRDNTPTSIYPEQTGIEAWAPTAEFGSTAVATELDDNGMSGTVSTGAGIAFYLALVTADGGISSGADGLTIAFREDSPWHPISVNLDGLSIVRYQVTGLGATGVTLADAPLAYATGATMPTPTTTRAAEAFRFGTAGDATTAAFVVTGGSVDFNISITPLTPSTLLWPDNYAITERTPTMTIRTDKLPDAINTAIGEGRAIATNFQLFLRKVTANGEPIADVTAEHLRFLITAGVIEPDDMSGDHGSVAESGVRVVSASATAMTITKDIAIT